MEAVAGARVVAARPGRSPRPCPRPPTGIRFTGSNLTGANLRDADLRGADFTYALMNGPTSPRLCGTRQPGGPTEHPNPGSTRKTSGGQVPVRASVGRRTQPKRGALSCRDQLATQGHGSWSPRSPTCRCPCTQSWLIDFVRSELRRFRAVRIWTATVTLRTDSGELLDRAVRAVRAMLRDLIVTGLAMTTEGPMQRRCLPGTGAARGRSWSQFGWRRRRKVHRVVKASPLTSSCADRRRSCPPS